MSDKPQTTPLYNKIVKMFRDAGIDILDGWSRYKNSISHKDVPHRTIRSEDKAKRIERRLKAHILMRYGR